MEAILIAVLIIAVLIVLGSIGEKLGELWGRIEDRVITTVIAGVGVALIILGANLPVAIGWLAALFGIYVLVWVWSALRDAWR